MTDYVAWIREHISLINRLVEKERIRDLAELEKTIGSILSEEIDKKALNEGFGIVTGETLKKYLGEVERAEKNGFKELLESERRKKDAEAKKIKIEDSKAKGCFKKGKHAEILRPEKVYRVIGIKDSAYRESSY